jgi:hypothetical protein
MAIEWPIEIPPINLYNIGRMTANSKQIGGNHYKEGGTWKDQTIQCWDYIAANNLGYLEGNIIKYVSRYKTKNGMEDLLKAQHYLEKLIEVTKNGRMDSYGDAGAKSSNNIRAALEALKMAPVHQQHYEHRNNSVSGVGSIHADGQRPNDYSGVVGWTATTRNPQVPKFLNEQDPPSYSWGVDG